MNDIMTNTSLIRLYAKTSTAALGRFPEDKLKLSASFHTGLQLDLRAAVFFFLARLPFTRRYTLTKGSIIGNDILQL